MSLFDKLFPNRVFRFKGPDKSFPKIDDAGHNSDFRSAKKIGRVSIGSLCFYYQDLGVKYYCSYDYIERAFMRVSECHPDDSPAYFYYRLILVRGEKEFANLIFNEEKDVREILDILKERNPSLAIGYVPPADGKRKASFR